MVEDNQPHEKHSPSHELPHAFSSEDWVRLVLMRLIEGLSYGLQRIAQNTGCDSILCGWLRVSYPGEMSGQCL